MSRNPWEGLADPSRVRFEDKGRPAVFLIPQQVLTGEIRERLERYLVGTFGGFQRSDALVSGVYTTDTGQVALDSCVQYEVSFLGRDFIRHLAYTLADIARETGEECIYFKAGEDTALLRPKP